MFTSNLKTAWRSFRASGSMAWINLGGLALGMTVVFLIALWIGDELGFNRYHSGYDRIARVGRMETWKGETGAGFSEPLPMGAALKTLYGSCFKYVVRSSHTDEQVLSAGDKRFTQRGNFMDPEGPDLFSLRMLKGNREGLRRPNSIFLNQSAAVRLFGRENPMDKLVTLNNRQVVKVAGVFEDLPLSATLHDMTFIAPLDLYMEATPWTKGSEHDWSNNYLAIYVMLNPGATMEGVSAKIKNLKLDNAGPEEAVGKPRVFLYPMSRWHLYTRFDGGKIGAGDQVAFLWFYGMIGGFVLLLACINFMNLGTARSAKRAREVGVRKVNGGTRGQLIRQFLAESLLVAFGAYVLALALAWLLLPWFNEVSAKAIDMPWKNGWFWVAGIGFTILTGLMAGSYPAFYLSSFMPAKVLKGTWRAGAGAALPRKILVGVQFTVSIALIVGTLVVYRQVRFARDRPVGYSGAGLLTIRMNGANLQDKFDVLDEALKRTGMVASAATSESPLTEIESENSGLEWEGEPQAKEMGFGTLSVSYDYGATVGWHFLEGRDFSRDETVDSVGLVINEAAVKALGLKHPLGTQVSWPDRWRRGGPLSVIGVVQDMVMESPFKPAFPTVFFLSGYQDRLFIRVNPSVAMGRALPAIETVFKDVYPKVPFDYTFADDSYGQKFASEERTGVLAGLFALLSVLISCLGLFGLASYIAEQRTKEIGIRKVLGASLFSLWKLLSQDFAYPILVSFLIALPVAYLGMHAWLERYAYRTTISWWILAASAGGALSLALGTISFKSIRASRANPVAALKRE